MQAGPLISLSPSFNSYSSTGKLAEIAARVVNEFRQENNVYDPWENDGDENLATQFGELSLNSNPHGENLPQQFDDLDGDEFEFASVCRDLGSSSPISADEIFYNGQIKPIYPLFNQDLLRNDDAPRNVVVVDRASELKTPTTTTTTTTTRRRQPLRKLMIEEEREMASTASCSSSESEELDGLSPESFCVWTPKTTAGESKTPGRCKKSNSTGSSKRWNFRQLLSRSNSEGKDHMFVFLTPSKKSEKGISSGDEKVAGKVAAKEVSVNGDGGVGAHEAHYVKNRTVKEEDKKKSFLPYRQDIVGFFSNVNGLSRNLHPF